MRRFYQVVNIIGAVLLTFALLLLSIHVNAFDERFYQDQYQKLGVAETVGMREEDLMIATDVLLDYCRLERDTIDLQLPIDGEVQEVFTPREKAHMVDVRNLAALSFDLKGGCFLAFVGCVAISMIFGKLRLRAMLKNTLYGVGIGLGVIVILGLGAATNFSWFWTAFHQLLFTNDLWLLSTSDVMINMVPEPFFYALVMRILWMYLLMMAGLIAVCVGVRALARRADAQEKKQNG